MTTSEQTTESAQTEAPTWGDVAAQSAQTEAETKTAASPVRVFTDELECSLTREEIAAKGEALAEVLKQIGELEESKKADNNRWKEKIDSAEKEAAKIAAVLRSGKETREVSCSEHRIFELGVVRVVRADTGEQVSERALTARERQQELALGTAEPVAESSSDAEVDVDVDVPDEDAGDDCYVTDPDALLDEAAKGHGEEPAKAKGKRGRKS